MSVLYMPMFQNRIELNAHAEMSILVDDCGICTSLVHKQGRQITVQLRENPASALLPHLLVYMEPCCTRVAKKTNNYLRMLGLLARVDERGNCDRFTKKYETEQDTRYYDGIRNTTICCNLQAKPVFKVRDYKSRITYSRLGHVLYVSLPNRPKTILCQYDLQDRILVVNEQHATTPQEKAEGLYRFLSSVARPKLTLEATFAVRPL